MLSFQTMLVRERITLTQYAVQGSADVPDNEAPPEVTVVRSNRLHLQLDGPVRSENVVIRAQNMQTTLRIGAKVLFSFYKSGPFANRAEPFDWQGMWDMLLTAYEHKYHPDLWATVYMNGKAVFRTAESPFVDVIEQCALLTVDNYDATMTLTEQALGKLGQNAKIEHAAKVAVVFGDDNTTMRCGVNQRLDGKDTTFNFAATGGEQYSRVVQGFQIAASFIEAIDVRHYMRLVQKKLRSGALTRSSPEMGKYNAGPQRLKDLRLSLEAFEKHFDVKYRPEKPDVFVPPKEST